MYSYKVRYTYEYSYGDCRTGNIVLYGCTLLSTVPYTVRYTYRTKGLLYPGRRNLKELIHKCYLFLHVLRVRTCSVAVPSVCHAFAVCHKMWPYRRDFDAANLSKKFKCKNEPCRTIFRG